MTADDADRAARNAAARLREARPAQDAGTRLPTWRVWLTGGRYVLVDAPDPDRAVRQLTRAQRGKVAAVLALTSEPRSEASHVR